MTECAICLEAVDDADDAWRCDVCTARAHWACCREWWCVGAGCPQCRQCAFATVLATAGVDASRLASTAERAYVFRAWVVALMLGGRG